MFCGTFTTKAVKMLKVNTKEKLGKVGNCFDFLQREFIF